MREEDQNFFSDSVLKEPNHPKIWHPFRQFSDRTACSPQ